MSSLKHIFLIIVLIIVIIILVYIRREYNDVVYLKSDIDNQLYLVRDLPDKQIACNLLATIKRNMFKLSEHLSQKRTEWKEYEKYIIQLNSKIYDAVLMESGENSVYTSYSVNKGEEIIFCLRSRSKETNKIHDLNLVMYVVLHEMAHVACPEYGHTELFKHIFAFLVTRAIELNLYSKIDFYKEPTEYCGLIITDSII